MQFGGTGEFRPQKPITILREQGKLVLEVCHFTQDLNPLWPTSSLLSKLQSLSAAITPQLKNLNNQEEKFFKASEYFFETLSFQFQQKMGNLQNHFLPQVLATREGPAPLLMLLFCSLMEELGVKTQVSSCRVQYLLKVQLDGRSHLIDFKEKCRPLQPYEIVELINQGFDFSRGSLHSEILVIEYLLLLKNLARKEGRLQILSLVHSYLMKYQPFNLRHLSERAVIAYETGDYKGAIEDIRSYFLYKQPEFNNLNLKKIYKRALKAIKSKENETPLNH